MKRKTKAEKLIDRRIERAYYDTCCNIQINVMDIGKIFAFGRIKIEAGEDDEQLRSSIRNYVETIRVG